ncbi:MAG: cytoplasmic protein [Euryarchaeota archaeon]|nr:cytoplasmic protein [Euryarchaeota archaeon]
MEERKVVLFAFNGDPMCFAHVLLNALDLKKRGFDVKVVIEGTATIQVAELADESKPFANLYKRVLDAGLIDCVCEACSNQTASQESVLKQGLTLCNEMSGHPSVGRYIEAGYEVLLF